MCVSLLPRVSQPLRSHDLPPSLNPNSTEIARVGGNVTTGIDSCDSSDPPYLASDQTKGTESDTETSKVENKLGDDNDD
jgi:hypothetical protein